MRKNWMLVVMGAALVAWVFVGGWVLNEVASAKPAMDSISRQQDEAAQHAAANMVCTASNGY